MKIFVHVGPPKTGTSAIQKWCSENRQLLLEKKVYYPKHDLDINGVSSGNLLTLFDKQSDGTLVFSNKKLENLKRIVIEKGADTLLLSSEFFFRLVPEIAKNVKNCIFIAYIRFELGIIESNYKQSVKRHWQTEKITISKNIKSNTLRLLTEYVNQYGEERFYFRAYGNGVFYRKDLVSDFLDSINLNQLISDVKPVSSRVNTAYSFEGLEFKRWFNKFHKQELQIPLDLFLQKQALHSSSQYSLIEPTIYKDLKAQCVLALVEFCSIFDVKNGAKLMHLSSTEKQCPFRQQTLCLDEFSKLTKLFVEDKKINYHLLKSFTENLSSKQMSQNDMDKLSKILEICEDKYQSKSSLSYLIDTMYLKSCLTISSFVNLIKK